MNPETKLHEWRIEPREYSRQEARRGRRHAFEQIDPASTALVVIDMVPFFVLENPYCRGIVPNVSLLADTLRSAGGAVAWVLPSSQGWDSPVKREFYGERVADTFRDSGGRGPLKDRIWTGFRIHDGDLIVEKSAASAFFPGRCALPDLLERCAIKTVLIAGTVTNVCCESSARDASTLGYRVIMVADGNASVSDRCHNATLHTIYRTFGDVRPTSEVLALIDDGAARASR